MSLPAATTAPLPNGPRTLTSADGIRAVGTDAPRLN